MSIYLFTIGSIWQTWALPQLCYGIGVWGRSDSTEVMEKFAYRCGKALLGAKHNVARAIVQAEMGWRSVRFWVRYHQCRTLSRLLRAPKGDLLRSVLMDQLTMLQSRPQQTWLQPVLQELSESNFRQAAPLRRWLQQVLPTLNPARMDVAREQLSAMGFEDAWAGTVLHDEHREWQGEVYKGASRAHFAEHVSERRDRGAEMDVKPRWATIMRPSRSLRHLVGRADSKLLSETRMGSPRSLAHRCNTDQATLGRECPCCRQQDDTASHMLQCGAIMGDIRVEEAFTHFHDAMEGRIMHGRAEEGDILNLGQIVQWMRTYPACGKAHKVLLGNCDLRQGPSNMRRAYLRMQVDPKLHNLWLQCCVGVIRAAWAAHDAAVEDRRAAVAPLLPVMARDGAEVPAAPRPQQPQTEVRSLVASFCAIVPNRRQQEQGGRNGRVRPAVGAHSGGSASEDSDSDELPPLGSLGELAGLHCAGQSSSSASNSGNGTHRASSAPPTACASSSLPALSGLGELARGSASAAHTEAASGGSGSASGAAGVQGDECDELSLMGFTPEEVTAAKAEVDESHSQLSQGSYRSPCIDCDEYDENCCECREEALLEAQSRRQAAAAEKQQRETWARMVAEGNGTWCDDCGQYDEECAGCRAAMQEVEDDMREWAERRRAAVGGRRVRS